ncbi:MAG: hypothetical protein ACJ74H_08415 [Thermoanaerobaculia bacterium]
MMKPIFALLAATILIAMPVDAQTCSRTDSWTSCWGKFNPPPTVVATAETDKAKEDVAEAVTGLTNLVSPGESSLKDFLSLFAASMESATTSEQGNAFAFDWNPRFAFAEQVGLKFQAVFGEAKLNNEVTKRLTENTDGLSDLTDSLEFGDDASLSGSVQQRNESYGRSIEPHRTWFQSMLVAIIPDTAAADFEAEKLRSRTFRIQSGQVNTPFEELPDPDDATKSLSEAQIAARISAIEVLARTFREERTAIGKFTEAFAKLLNNQPQYYGSVLYHTRRNIVGPNEWNGEFTYEFAGNNINAFRRKHPECKAIPDGDRAAASACAQNLQIFADDAKPGIERFAVSAEYHRANRRWIDDPDLGLEFGFPRSRAFVGSLALGTKAPAIMPLRAATTGVGDARFDLTAKYELPEDDASEAKGFVATLTYTQKISDTFSLPLSFVYSDHDSDLINVQKRFSARFGLMYKLPDFK